jgi:hypothetical protein
LLWVPQIKLTHEYEISLLNKSMQTIFLYLAPRYSKFRVVRALLWKLSYNLPPVCWRIAKQLWQFPSASSDEVGKQKEVFRFVCFLFCFLLEPIWTHFLQVHRPM